MMQPNPNSVNRSALVNDSHSKSYDPSAPYRALMMPPPPVTTEMPPNNQYSSNPTLSQDAPRTNIDPKSGVIKRIPQFYYPRYNEADGPPFTQPNFVDPRETNPNLLPPPPPPVVEQPVPNQIVPYSQPMDPYGSDPYYPYAQPYLIPLTANIDPVPNLQDQSKSDVFASHQKDADLSRLEVYHFTPKNALSMGSLPVQQSQPIIQYHVYPYPPAAAVPPLPMSSQQQQQQFPLQPYPWYGYPPNVPPYEPEPSQPLLPFIETKARGSQTEPPATKNRGVSPIRFPSVAHIPAPIYDDDGYPYVHQRTMHTDRYNITTGRINRHFYDSNRSTPLADCRCLDCQRERAKVLNYYPD